VRWTLKIGVSLLLLACIANAYGQIAQKVVDIPTRLGVSQRMVVLVPQNPKAAVILFSGGSGGLQISSNGSFKGGEGNFLVRSRQLFADQGLLVVVVDAPSDRQTSPFLGGFRQRPEHAADIKAVIAWGSKPECLSGWSVQAGELNRLPMWPLN
jgi:hypothetical protein